jgi:hypothetical protein
MFSSARIRTQTGYAQKNILGISSMPAVFFSQALILNKNPH